MKNLFLLWNNYFRFHTWHSENKIIILWECDMNVLIKKGNLSSHFSRQQM